MKRKYFSPLDHKSQLAIAHGSLDLYCMVSDDPHFIDSATNVFSDKESLFDYMRDVRREIASGNLNCCYKNSYMIHNYVESGLLDITNIEQTDEDTWAILTFPTELFYKILDATSKGLWWNVETQSVDYEKTSDFYPKEDTRCIGFEGMEMISKLPKDDEMIQPIISRVTFWLMNAVETPNGWEKQIDNFVN